MSDAQSRRRTFPWWMAMIPLVIGYLIDQITKYVVVENMSEGQSIPVIPPLLHWYFIRNPGAAFSIGTDYTWIFTIIQTLALGVVMYLIISRARTLPWLITLGCLAAGIAGNLTDRLFREPGFGVGHVVDFISLPNFAIFNIADSLIVCSMIAVVILIFTGLPMNDHAAEDEAPVEPARTESPENVSD
ncbi:MULTISPECIES: signal peptidase II [Auritidibacter]|uniref:signal peptidase II n=1 Tax=Auritidibacter TaxID=1160973 RepID=UPI001F2C86A2|nr:MULTISPECIES: signal peptidase II [Auritidibacter]WGH89193.1 signal peptidase II [Auritidibacter ignavus]WHS34661.1 signal peptidase II [Auritidibacter ignavus]